MENVVIIVLRGRPR